MRYHECSAEEINMVKKRITLEGYVESESDVDHSIFYEKLINAFAKIFVELGEYTPLKYDPLYLPVETQLDKIKFLIGFEPKVQASFDFSSNTVKINLFILSLFSSLSVFSGLIDMLKSNNSMDIFEILRLFEEKHVNKEGAAEFKEMFNKWGQYSIQMKEEDKFSIIWSFSEINNTEHYDIVFTAIRLIFHHEMAHWHFSKFNDRTRKFYYNLARNELQHHLQSEESIFEEDIWSLLTEPDIDNWVEEIVADTMSLSSLLNRSRNSPEEKRDVYIAIGLYFALIETQEKYNSSNKVPIKKTHPPARLREEIVRRLLANSLNMNITEYIASQSAAWFFYSCCINIALQNYRREIYG